MATENNSKYYFKASDLSKLIEAGSYHIVVNVNTSMEGETIVFAEGFDEDGNSKGTYPGCPWPCGGKETAISKESLDQADKAVTGGTLN